MLDVILITIFIPFLGTSLGALMVFLMKDKVNEKFQKLLIGFAAGVMIAASVWSLIMPAIEESSHLGVFSWVPAAVGFLLGVFFLLFLDSVIPHLHLNSDEPEGGRKKNNVKKTTMFFLAVTLHNIPEGIAVGVLLAGAFAGGSNVTLSAALALAIGLAIQNFPEGAIISMPLKKEGFSKKKAFLYGVISGIVEPIAAYLTLIMANLLTSILPYLLSFAAGAMIYVVVEELIPESQEGKHSNLATIAVAIGFTLMMILDIALGKGDFYNG